MDVITAFDLSKLYGAAPALRGVNLKVPEGAAFACVGGAGAGKTTLVRLLAGLRRPTSGECGVLGLNPAYEAARLHGMTGVVLQSARLYSSMSLMENLRFYAGVNGVPVNDGVERISFLLHRLNIWEDRDQRPGALPTGVLFRAGLARALLHRPRVLLLDEEGAGMDRETAERVKGLLLYLREEEGVTLLMCTQNMNYAQGICDGFYAVNASLMNGFHGVDNAICNLGYNVQQGFNATQLAMLQGQNALSTQLAQCCCDNRAGQKDIQYQMATDTCAVTTALANNTRDIIDNQNANYRGLMDFMVQSKIDALQSENQALRLSASQQAQNTVIGAMIDASRAEILRYPLCAAVLLPAHGACPACALIAEAPVILDRTGQVQRRFYFPHFLAVRVVRRVVIEAKAPIRLLSSTYRLYSEIMVTGLFAHLSNITIQHIYVWQYKISLDRIIDFLYTCFIKIAETNSTFSLSD